MRTNDRTLPRSRRGARPLAAVAFAVLCSFAGVPGGGASGQAAEAPAPPTATDPSAAEAEALLARVRAAWSAREALSARFEQTQEFAGFDEPLQSAGRLRILRPSYFDLTFDPPHRQLQVSDGSFVWTYLPEQGQVLKAPLSPDASRGADLLEWALEGSRALSIADDPAFEAPARRIEVAPGPRLPLDRLAVWVAPGGADILGYEAVDAEGNRTRMRLVEVRAAPKLAPSDFRFTPPPGVEVVELGSGGGEGRD